MGIGSVGGRRAVFLDRDGVLNEPVLRSGKPHPPASIDELSLMEGVKEALDLLRARGFLLIVVTNQPDVARGAQRREAIEEMHRWLFAQLPLDEILACYHDDADNCACRKPKPGMLADAAARYGVDLGKSYMVGDRWRDIDAGHAAGCISLLLDYGYTERGPSREPDARLHSLREAAAWILDHSSTSRHVHSQ